jgi:GNAT superfamily N-acetyltransferase
MLEPQNLYKKRVGFAIRELDKTTWPDFVRIMEKHDGVWGGCWCVEFHLARGESNSMGRSRRALKEKLVGANRSHAALVYEGAEIVGWCQFGPPSELPARMGGFAKLGKAVPDWRITCFFVDRDHRKQGVSAAALKGALRLIAAGGGGTVDGYPTSTQGKPYSSSFLWAGTESMFAGAGFKPLGALGKTKSVMR